MDNLDEISVEKLQGVLDNVEGNKPTQRLLAAIAYKNGVTQSELAEWHDTGRRTIYSWLMRLDTDEPLEQAVSDAHRSGRKRKLSESHALFCRRLREASDALTGRFRQANREMDAVWRYGIAQTACPDVSKASQTAC